MMEEREPKMLRAFTAMEVDASGQLKTGQIQSAPFQIPGFARQGFDAIRILVPVCARASAACRGPSAARTPAGVPCRHPAAAGSVRHRGERQGHDQARLAADTPLGA